MLHFGDAESQTNLQVIKWPQSTRRTVTTHMITDTWFFNFPVSPPSLSLSAGGLSSCCSHSVKEKLCVLLRLILRCSIYCFNTPAVPLRSNRVSTSPPLTPCDDCQEPLVISPLLCDRISYLGLLATQADFLLVTASKEVSIKRLARGSGFTLLL